ncbi:retrotransposon ORF1 [Tanacetum coccineum]
MKYDGKGPSLTINHALTREELSREELEKDLWERIVILNEPRPIIETLKYGDTYKKILDTVLLDKLKLDGELELDEVEANEEMGRYDNHALADTGSNINIIPYRIFEKLGREQVKQVRHNVSMLNHSEAKLMGMIKDVLCQVGITTVLARFLVLDMPVDRTVSIIVERSLLHTCGGIINTLKGTTLTFDRVFHQKFYVAEIQNDGEESHDDDDVEYYLKRDEMGRPFYGPNLISYFDKHDPMKPPLHHTKWVPKGFGDFDKEVGDGKWHIKIRVTDPYGNTFEQGDEAMLEIKVYEVGGQEEIFSSEAWRRLFDTNERIYTELCHEFYSTYDFDEVCVDDELVTKKLIKFRLCGRSGLRSDENFDARDYWLSISSVENLHLSKSLASTIRSPILRVLQKMITYGVCQRTTWYDKVQRNKLWLMSMFEAKHQNGYANVAWLMAKSLKRKGVKSQRDSMICSGQFIMKIAKRMGLLTNEVFHTLSASTYYRALDATTLRELIDSNRRLITEDPAPGVPRVAMSRGLHPSMQDLYDRMGNMEIRQRTLERMARR